MKKWIISIVVVIVVASGGFAAYNYFTNKNETAASPAIQTQTTAAELGNVEVTVSGTGNISAENKEAITAEGNATVEAVNVAVGDTVTAGDELLTFVDDKIDPIVAPFSGEITALNVDVDGNVQMGTELITVTDYNNLEMIVNVDELDISKVQVGQTAKVEVSALSDKEFTGTVTSVAKEANEDSTSSTAKYQVNIKINEPTEIKIGMTAEATITIDKKENVLTVPVAAIQKQDDQYYVLIPSKDQAATSAQTESSTNDQNKTQQTIQTKQQTIEIGLQTDTLVEIVSGLTEGDEVVLPTLNSNNSNNQNQKNMIQGGFFNGGNMGQGGMPPGDRSGMRNQGGTGQ
ncbi:HlyD family efflux transporter periplasmic adaptor subunit [Bacillus sp. DNRA2]|uniref:efflux RND transporter periplasmic adaptor subunit n=1 Tax=Bacillus sp. DNRA2 TaxID=2723053 RepID=UPI00145F7ABC|nr:HlyD family efflux transporter periplasmic adaptor subunit [Bacillus sp. DNRA2]NMD68951.1 HlyD family efflux transporter periplasmic adaptor subunit [Bacillus sp. DNRA2]